MSGGEAGVSTAARAVCPTCSEAMSTGPELEGAGLGDGSGAEGNAPWQKMEEVYRVPEIREML